MPLMMFGIFVLPALGAGIAYYLRHRERVLKLKYSRAAELKPDTALLARIEALEKKCEMLQEQVNDAHALLVDERRALDQKLAQKLAEGSAAIPDPSANQNRSPAPLRTLQ
jgi:hypothetical protein